LENEKALIFGIPNMLKMSEFLNEYGDESFNTQCGNEFLTLKKHVFMGLQMNFQMCSKSLNFLIIWR
jgi:hypothetical protein